MAANNNIQITNLDFDSIKTNLKTFMQGQTKFKDYDFEGSGLAVLMDLLAYNTHYNAYYLNMIANEMFMDTATKRSSVVSHAKLLNYTPRSATAPSATINLISTSVLNQASLTLPKFTRFQSEAIDGTNYIFITKDVNTVSVIANTATFTDIELVQGEPISLSFTVNNTTNPKQIFTLPDANIDTATLVVQVQKSSTNIELNTYNLATSVSSLNGASMVYFLQEGLDGNYQIYFGDNIIGKHLDDGNIVNVTYISTSGSAATGANNFVLLDSIAGSTVVYPVSPATNGGQKESIDSIKFQAPRYYGAQGRAVSYDDYITAIAQNNLGFAIDSVSVWGGEDNDPPAYGQVFVSIKPKDSYALTDSQKTRMMNDVIRPISVVTVKPTLVDPDYVYLKVAVDVTYDQKLTTLTASQIADVVKAAVLQYGNANLNLFTSTFSYSDLSIAIQNCNPSIIANDAKIYVQKKFFPTLGASKQYILKYGLPLKRSVYNTGITSRPTVQYYTTGADITLISDLYLEEVPFATSGLDSINVLNPGFNYTSTPLVVITGDGSGATAHAVIKNGYISEIVLDNPGQNYSQALVSIVNAPGDSSGTNGSAYVHLQGRYGTLRSFYYENNVKTILNSNIGTIDYQEGTITLNSFAPYDINDPLGQLTLTANPDSTIVSSTRNRIVTIDAYDPNAITVNVTAK